MANQISTEQREQAAADRIREYLTGLYGDEERLIVRNTTNGVVSIGFGKLGDEGGMSIERSKLPIVLTDHFPREFWISAPDFRKAVAKGWLVPVKNEEYEREIDSHRAHLAELSRLAAKDDAKRVTHQPTAPNPFSDEPIREGQVLDEDTAQLKPASQDERMRKFMEYEGQEQAERPQDNTPPGVNVLGDNVSSRAVAFCNEQKNGSVTAQQAIEWLDAEEKVLTDDDLLYVVRNAGFESVKSVARRLLADR